MGVAISEIGLILRGHNCNDILQKRREELIAELEKGQRQLSQIEFILQGERVMNYSATIKELPGCIVYSKQINLPNYNPADYRAYFEIIPKIGEVVSKKYPELKCATPEYCFIVYPEGEHRDNDITIEFCEAIEKSFPDFDDIKFKEIEACMAVSVMHKGAYSGLAQAYAYACKWIEENGYTVANNPRENFIDGIWNKESDDEWLTEIQIPVMRK